MSVQDLSPVTQDYLKAIWACREWSEDAVTIKTLGARLKVASSTASETVARLVRQGLVIHEPYGSIELTPRGLESALEMVRRHRLIETFLVNELGYTWDQVHDEAEELEHAVSPEFVERIDVLMGRPRRDPHGDPIPSVAGGLQPARAVLTLGELVPGQSAVVERVSDADAAMLRYLAASGIVIDAMVSVVERRDYAGIVVLHVAGRLDAVHLGEVAAKSVWVGHPRSAATAPLDQTAGAYPRVGRTTHLRPS